jgi:hypothetical protein
MSAILPRTEYFEIDSAIAGVRYAVWVNTPMGYEKETDHQYPAIFTVDGNMMAPCTMPYSVGLSQDPLHPIVPFVQVMVGYCGDEVPDWGTVYRNRDLLPPGEPASPRLMAMAEGLVKARGEIAESMKKFISSVREGGRADNFLRFLAEELHPQITARWRIDTATTGLFGDSYGGLFAAWVAMQRHPLFTRIGAGSPGMMTEKSKVFDLLTREIESGADHSGRHLHMSIGELEITVPSIYQQVGCGFVRFVTTLGETPLKGLTFTSAIIPNASHITTILPNWLGFLRACYPAR